MIHALIVLETLITFFLPQCFVIGMPGRLSGRSERLTLLVILPLMVAMLLAVIGAYVVWGIHLGAGIQWIFIGFILYIAGITAGMILNFRARARRKFAALPRGAWRRPVARAAVVFLAALSVEIGTLWLINRHKRAEMAAIRAEADQIVAGLLPPQIPDADNAALIYEQAFAELDQANLDSDDVVDRIWNFNWPPGHDVEPAQRQEIAGILERSQKVLVLLHQAVEKPNCRFPLDHHFDNTISGPVVVPHLPKAASVLALAGRFHAANGETALALADVNALFRLRKHSESLPSIIGTLVTDAIDGAAVSTLETVLATGPLDGKQLAAVDPGDSPDFRKVLQCGLLYEKACWLRVLADFPLSAQPAGDGAGALSQREARFLAFIFRIWFAREELNGLSASTNRAAYIVEQPYGSAVRLLRDADNDENWSKSFLFPWSAGGHGAALRAATRTEARHRLAFLALALARYRADHGQYPDKLDSLIPQYIAAIPIDPFDDQPLRLAVTDKQIVLYSIGPDLKDDGGKPMDDRNVTGDVTFTLPR